MINRTMAFELMVSAILMVTGSLLFRLDIASPGLLAVGALLMVFTLTRYRALLPELLRACWPARAPLALDRISSRVK